MLELSHKNLEVYKLSLLLVKEVYTLTWKFPKVEQYVLVSQLRRAAISVCSNIAEGASRISKPEKKRYYEVARSSLVEMDTQIEASLVLNYINKEQIKTLEPQVLSIFRILSKMISNLDR